MGIGTVGAQLLFAAKAVGADFTASLMLGRQSFSPEPAALRRMFRCHGIALDPDEFCRGSKGWGEALFELLGATSVSSLDASSFEGADVLHDLNVPIGASLKRRFTLVFDGGTLEHIFNVPVALEGCMDMLAEGGFFVQVSPANNFMGHGFYQFSPELIFRTFSVESGFEIIGVFLAESVRGGRWYSVTDPAVVRKRVQMTNRVPTSICTIAKKARSTTGPGTIPQQADYAAEWRRGTRGSSGLYKTAPGWRARASRLAAAYLPAPLERLLRQAYTPSIASQSDCYEYIEEEQLVRGTFRRQPSRITPQAR